MNLRIFPETEMVYLFLKCRTVNINNKILETIWWVQLMQLSSRLVTDQSGNALARVQWVHKPIDLWDITFCTRRFWGFYLVLLKLADFKAQNRLHPHIQIPGLDMQWKQRSWRNTYLVKIQVHENKNAPSENIFSHCETSRGVLLEFELNSHQLNEK